MIFKQYLLQETTDTEAATNVAMINTGAKNENIDIIVDKLDPNVMTGRVVNGNKYCIYKRKIINLTELANQIRALYISKGYGIISFAKLQDMDFIKYSRTKVVLKQLFDNENSTVEIDPKNAAQYFMYADCISY